jgi:hypothetical protein
MTLTSDPRGRLSEDGARQAILNLGEYTHAPMVFRPRTDVSGRPYWYCDLQHKTFAITVMGGDIAASFTSFGVFDRIPGQPWHARLTGWSSP